MRGLRLSSFFMSWRVLSYWWKNLTQPSSEFRWDLPCESVHKPFTPSILKILLAYAHTTFKASIYHRGWAYQHLTVLNSALIQRLIDPVSCLSI
jgi:hypothetical protein